jgi:hypothetical protein
MSHPQPDLMSPDQASRLGEFARACKAALRAVSLYPGAHPAIAAALGRVAATSGALLGSQDATLTVHPDKLMLDGRAAAKPDAAAGELAALLHERLIGSLGLSPAVTTDDWRALLLLLARPTEDLVEEGGIARLWGATGRAGFAIREIDYAEVLRERAAGDAAEWDRIIAHCLQSDARSLDEAAIAALLEALGDTARFEQFLDQLQRADASGGPTIGARAAALVLMLRAVLAAAAQRGLAAEPLLQTAAAASAQLTPQMMVALLQCRGGSAEDADVVSTLVQHMTDQTIATFVAGSVAAERGATARLAQAFEALVPDGGRKGQLLELAHADAQQGELGRDERFEDLWQGAASMLMSYSDATYVSDEYGRELSEARSQAIEVEKASDDPPERIQEWLASVSEPALRTLDALLLLDLLQLEADDTRWRSIAAIVTADIERRTLLGDVDAAQQLVARLVSELAADGRADLRPAAAAAVEQLAAGPLVRNLVLHLRKAEDRDVGALQRLCTTLGPALVRPLAEALAIEDNSRAIRRLREILLGFGAAGRQSVEQLKNSSNPAVRRAAIDLLRLFGGDEALAELASMLGDSDPQVQRESIRAIVQIGSDGAYAVLQRALVASSASRATVLQELIGLRDDKAIPLLCYVLNHTRARGTLVRVHAEIIQALGGLGTHPDSTQTLRDVLHRGEWWAPSRTRTLRQASAAALRRIGSADSVAVLDDAAANGSRGVRHAARAHAVAAARRERERA